MDTQLTEQAGRGPDSGQAGSHATFVETRTVRLAIGILSDPDSLWAVLSGLAALGLDSRHACLVALDISPAVLAHAHGHDRAQETFKSLFEDVRELEGIFGAVVCKASSGPLLEDICASEGSIAVDGRCVVRGWLSERQRQRIAYHLMDGATALLVSSATPAQQDACCRILLRLSQHGVQTHDFTARFRRAEATD